MTLDRKIQIEDTVFVILFAFFAWVFVTGILQ